jgi:protein-disulfide isomerase
VGKCRWFSCALFVIAISVAVTGLQVQAQSRPSPAKPLAEVNGQAITEEEIDKAIASQLGKLQEQIYNLRRQRVESLIRDQLLAQEAKRRGLSVQKLLDSEEASKIGLVTEEEIEQFFQANKARFKDGDEVEIRDQIRARLQGQKVTAQREAFVQSLRAKAKVTVHLQPPAVVRVDVPIDGAALKGARDAPVTIVEFSDFHCPFCKRVIPTLKDIEVKYPGKVRLAFRDLPLDQLHPGARKAHEAARCARDQGKFWEYHDTLFANEPDSSPQRLKTYAKQVGLDLAKFDACVAAGTHAAAVQKGRGRGDTAWRHRHPGLLHQTVSCSPARSRSNASWP